MNLGMGFTVGFLVFILSYFIFYSQMFDRIKPSDETSASSAQGEKFKVDTFVAVILLSFF